MSQSDQMMLSDKGGVITLIEACHSFGVKDIVICPGSRNAPLTVSFNQSGLFTCHSIVDERVAAFYALGMSIATKAPVAVVCTSGSALLNFAPAVAEAFYQKVPVIAISADRPLEWTDQGNGQTIRQEGALDNFVLDGFSVLCEPTNMDEQWRNKRKLSEAFNKALNQNRGPIHINVPLAEPLYDTLPNKDFGKTKFFTTIQPELRTAQNAISELGQSLNAQKRVMILIGQMDPNPELNEALKVWVNHPDVVILSETTSNIDCPGVIDTIDRIIMSEINPDKIQELMPDALITLGGFVVSKKIKAVLRQFQPKLHFHLSEYDQTVDTYQCLSAHIKSKAAPFLNAIFPALTDKSTEYNQTWSRIDQRCTEGHDSYMAQLPYSDFAAFKTLLNGNLGFDALHLSNSSPVRYTQLFGKEKGVPQYANRGTSGIDGCTSTAAGFAKKASDKQHLLITGDVSFMYDSNALWNAEFPENLKIVVINNGGGGIFRIINGPSTTSELEPFFETQHPVKIQALAEAHDIPYIGCSGESELTESVSKLAASKGKTILEIKTPKTLNDGVLKGYFAHIRKYLED